MSLRAIRQPAESEAISGFAAQCRDYFVPIGCARGTRDDRGSRFEMRSKYQIPNTQYCLGMTLIEILTVASIAAIAVVALVRFVVVAYPIQKQTLLQSNANETARIQLERIAREIREARQSESGAYPLVEMQPQRIVFFADVDSDDRVERVRYSLQGTNLQRGVIEPSGDPIVYDEDDERVSTVSSFIQNGTRDIFSYYNGDYPSDTTPLSPMDLTEVKYIQFLLFVDADPNQRTDAVEVRSQVQIRNLKTNLGETI